MDSRAQLPIFLRRGDFLKNLRTVGCVLLVMGFCLPMAIGSDPVRIIFDTDLESDVDDVGAIAVLHALADRGEVRILAMGVSSGHPFSVPCLSALNTFYGRPDIPVGVFKGPAPLHQSKYTEQIATEYPHKLRSADEAPEAAHVYRSVLAAQPDQSVVLVTVGFLTNVRRLLQTGPDGHSPLDGRQLVAKKVRRWVCMGGAFPQGREFNLFSDAAASREAIQQWPGEIIFSGFEIGDHVLTGPALRQLPQRHVARRCYELFNQLEARSSWDQTAVLFAARGERGQTDALWSLSEPGCCVVAEDGSNTWQSQASCRHRYLIAKAAPQQVAAVIEALMIEAKGNVPQ
jgi:inosine-uridine nucleoside N-ribohydrolase